MRNFFKSFLTAALFLSPIAANAQVFDPVSQSRGGNITGDILYSTGVPAATGTGTPTLATGSDNVKGIVTAGTSATSVVITFSANYYKIAPSCIAETQTQITSFAYAVTVTALTVTQTATSGNLINYRCDPMS